MIDTHAHLNEPRFGADVDAVRARAREAGVSSLVVVGYDLPSSRSAVRLAAAYGDAAAVGIHPHDATTVTDTSLAQIEELTRQRPVVAVGETGLDYHYNFSSRDLQRQVFRDHIRLAKRVLLPLVIHCRDAFEDLYSILDREGASEVGGVIHCFTGSVEDALGAVERGFFVGISGVVTFPRSDGIRQAVLSIPIDRLLLETDCPYMAPQPVRGRRCEPAHLRFTAEVLARLRNLTTVELEQVCDSNAFRCFPLLRGLPAVADAQATADRACDVQF
ncbi:MAG: TatD family hydrolase [Armatimonadota bacterium]